MTRENKLRSMTGIALAFATLLSRLPFRAKTFFEFDSINFAVATFRFDLGQVTPQMPGYILHVLFGRLLYLITGDLNQAYIWVSVLLSIGAVLLLWRAAAALRGERVALIAGLLWLTTPLFWFHGCVNAIYAEEAFFTSLLLYFGINIITNSISRSSFVIFYFIAFSLAGAARPTSLLFFLPATLFLIWKQKPSQHTLATAFVCFLVVIGVWVGELLREAGGISAYWSLFLKENNFKTQSILFGNSWQSQLDTIEKVAFYLPISLGAATLALVAIAVCFPQRIMQFVRVYIRNSKSLFVAFMALPPLLFYAFIFFMKAGYLLNVVPCAILVVAVLLDQAAIWLAEQQKGRLKDKRILTRPIITRNAVVFTVIVVFLNGMWFLIPWPGTDQKLYDNEDTRNSFIHGAMHRYEHSESRLLTLANRALEYTNVSGIRAVDSLNNMTLSTLLSNNANNSGQVILASWWYRWCYLLLPHAVTYDLELNPVHADSLWVGRAHEMERVNLYDSVIRFHSTTPVLLLLRHDRPDFDEVARHVHLERLPLPEYLDIYKVLDSTFTIRWENRTFISQ
jgi:Dolichyl-phosphate-mannose-protein mannosyltransferase